jgi:hypothetical protein
MRWVSLVVFGLAGVVARDARGAETNTVDKIFVAPIKGEGISKETLSVLFDFVVIAVDRAGVMSVVTMEDLQDQLDQERRKDALGCTSIACAVELGGALGVRYLLSTRVKKLASDVIITASFIDTTEQKSKNGQGRCKDDAAEYEPAVKSAVAEALGLLKVKLNPGAEPASPPPSTPAPPPSAPKPPDVTGVWTTSEGNISFTQSGETVTGRYPTDNGQIVGTFKSNVLDGYWIEDLADRRCTEPRQGRYYWGAIRWEFQGSAFVGRWGYCGDSPNEGTWSGRRAP